MQIVREVDDGEEFRKPEQIYKYVEEFANEDREYFLTIGLDTKNRPVYREISHIGTLNSGLTSPREIFRRAVAMACKSIVVCHNHPSGDNTPSNEDIVMTAELGNAGEILGIKLLDHLIISRKGFYSMKSEGHI